jgi:hypothetical protein
MYAGAQSRPSSKRRRRRIRSGPLGFSVGLRARYFAENFADLDDVMAAVFDRIVEGKVDPRRARIKLREVLATGPVSRSHRQKAMASIGAILNDLLPPATGASDYDPKP